MATKNGALTAKELTHCAMLGALFYIVFHMFANLLYVEAITFSIFVCAQVFSRKEVVMACALTGLLQLLFMASCRGTWRTRSFSPATPLVCHFEKSGKKARVDRVDQRRHRRPVSWAAR